MNLIKIGNYIMTKRKELTLTQEQLAEKVGVSSKTISKWECGKSLPDHNIIELLCNVLKITTSELINGEDNSKIDDKQNIEMIERIQKLENQKNRQCRLFFFHYSVMAFRNVSSVISYASSGRISNITGAWAIHPFFQ